MYVRRFTNESPGHKVDTGSLRDTLQGFVTEFAVAYVPRGTGQRSLHSSPREGKASYMAKGGRCVRHKDRETCVMQKVEPLPGVIQKELMNGMTHWRAVCGESRKHGSEGGCRKSAQRQLACCLPCNGAIHRTIGHRWNHWRPQNATGGVHLSESRPDAPLPALTGFPRPGCGR